MRSERPFPSRAPRFRATPGSAQRRIRRSHALCGHRERRASRPTWPQWATRAKPATPRDRGASGRHPPTTDTPTPAGSGAIRPMPAAIVTQRMATHPASWRRGRQGGATPRVPPRGRREPRPEAELKRHLGGVWASRSGERRKPRSPPAQAPAAGTARRQPVRRRPPAKGTVDGPRPQLQIALGDNHGDLDLRGGDHLDVAAGPPRPAQGLTSRPRGATEATPAPSPNPRGRHHPP